MSVSVVIPAYNRAHRLAAAIESALRQRQQDVEIIVVDDGSTDGTRVVAERYPQVRYVHQANAGVGAARNTGIRHATREFIAFLDSDDRWEDFKLEVQLRLFSEQPKAGLLFSDFTIEKPDGRSQPNGASMWAGRELDFLEMSRVELSRPAFASTRWPAPSITCWVGPMYRQLLDELPILTSSVIVRRAALDAETWYTECVALFEDWEFFARVARRAEVGYITVPTTVNVGHNDPGRVSKCSAFDRAESYLSLLERNWLANPDFVSVNLAAARSAHGRALLAVVREALLAGRRDRARAALGAWRGLGFGERKGWAAIYAMCAQLVGGRTVLRQILRGQAVGQLVTGARKRMHGSVNPAA